MGFKSVFLGYAELIKWEQEDLGRSDSFRAIKLLIWDER